MLELELMLVLVATEEYEVLGPFGEQIAVSGHRDYSKRVIRCRDCRTCSAFLDLRAVLHKFTSSG